MSHDGTPTHKGTTTHNRTPEHIRTPANTTTIPANTSTPTNTTIPANTSTPTNTTIPDNTTNIHTNTTTIPDNTTNIHTNTTTIPANTTIIPTNTTNSTNTSTSTNTTTPTIIPANTTIPTNTTKIPTNTTTIPTNTTNSTNTTTPTIIPANTTIPTNTTTIPTNTTTIPTTTTNSTNTSIPTKTIPAPANTNTPTNITIHTNTRPPCHYPLLVLLVLIMTGLSDCQDITVRLRQGTVKGVVQISSNREIYAYLGIPYAKPPVGDLRFQAPQRHNGWEDTLEADQFGPSCPQPYLTGINMDEDCLTINVWCPRVPQEYRRYPVVVLIEGELFLTSAPSRFPAQDLAATDLIVVSFNYRTNAFGFLTWQDRSLPGNLGLRDQSLALQWVAENVDKFGGDLTRVTLLGHSAGAASAAYHLVNTNAQGPFQQIILMSGSLLSPWALSRSPRQAAMRLAHHLNCGSGVGSKFLLRCLRNRDAAQIVKAVERLVEDGNPRYLFGPVIDSGYLTSRESIVPLRPMEALLRNANRRVPLLITLSQDDGSIMLYVKREISHMTLDDLTRYGREVLVPLVTGLGYMAIPAVDRMVQYAYLDKAQTKEEMVKEIVKLFTDALFKAPQVRTAQGAKRRGLNTFLAVNTFISRDIYATHSNITGALHGSELAYLFSPAAYRRLFNMPLTNNEERISSSLKRMVYTFASNGEPSLNQYAPRWEQFSVANPTYASLESGQIHKGYQSHQVAFWNYLLPEMAQLVSITSTTESSTYYPGRPTNKPIIITPDEPYESAVWVLLAIVLILLGLIVAYIVCKRRRRALNSSTLNGS